MFKFPILFFVFFSYSAFSDVTPSISEPAPLTKEAYEEKLQQDPIYFKADRLVPFYKEEPFSPLLSHRKCSFRFLKKIKRKVGSAWDKMDAALSFWSFSLNNYPLYQKLDSINVCNIPNRRVTALKLKDIFFDTPIPKLLALLDGFGKGTDPNSSFIVSLASYGPRVEKGSALMALVSVLQNTKRPKAIVLYLTEPHFPDHKIKGPFAEAYKILQDKGVTIRYMKNDFGPHTKYFYAAQEFPEMNIITIDDDQYYDKHLFANLLKDHETYPQAIITGRALQITPSGLTFSQDLPLSCYLNYDLVALGLGLPSLFHFATGVGSILYPKGVLSELQKLVEENNLHVKYRNSDDEVLKIAAVMLGYPVKKASGLPMHCILSAAKPNNPGRLWEEFNGRSIHPAYPHIFNVDVVLHDLFSERFPKLDNQNAYERLHLLPNPEVLEVLEVIKCK